ncbi:unnamed protein product [Dovyalis caffra]|uniref:Uncharacterized protein n=1 Tax=Dovyalis caffra TaxID=77055 RepID=A0AAV1S3P3_9ROSI|nr:unnamed protein product [Dovyalis caffra]
MDADLSTSLTKGSKAILAWTVKNISNGDVCKLVKESSTDCVFAPDVEATTTFEEQLAQSGYVGSKFDEENPIYVRSNAEVVEQEAPFDHKDEENRMVGSKFLLAKIEVLELVINEFDKEDPLRLERKGCLFKVGSDMLWPAARAKAL